MANNQELNSGPEDADPSVEENLFDGLAWSSQLAAAVGRRQRLADLNVRLANHMKLLDDARTQSRLASLATGSSVPARTQRRAGMRIHTNVELAKLEAAMTAKLQNLRNSLNQRCMRFDTVRRTLNALNDRNAELTDENNELKSKNEQILLELSQARDANENLRRELKNVGNLAIVLSSEQLSLRKLKSSPENGLFERPRRHRDLGLRTTSLCNAWLVDATNALQNGTTTSSSTEISPSDFDRLPSESNEVRWHRPRRPSLLRENFVSTNLVAMQLRSAQAELEFVKLDSERRTRQLQQKITALSERQRRREIMLQRSHENLQSVIETLNSFIEAGDSLEAQLDAYRALLDQEEDRCNGTDGHGFGVNSSTSQATCQPLSREPERSTVSRLRTTAAAAAAVVAAIVTATTAAPAAIASCGEVESVTSNVGALEIASHDVRGGKYIVFRNASTERLDISDWLVVHQCGADKASYRFPKPFIIEARRKVIVWSADVVESYLSPMNYVLEETILPWCNSECLGNEIDLITTVYNRIGGRVASRKSRIPHSVSSHDQASSDLALLSTSNCSIF